MYIKWKDEKKKKNALLQTRWMETINITEKEQKTIFYKISESTNEWMIHLLYRFRHGYMVAMDRM